MSTLVKEHMRQAFATHVLEDLQGSAEARVFRMHRPGGEGQYLTFIYFTRIGIIIGGDLRILDYQTGVVSWPGYGLSWFASNLDPSYLAEKFLPPCPPARGLKRKNWENSAGWLAACQQRFRELYEARLAALSEGGAA